VDEETRERLKKWIEKGVTLEDILQALEDLPEPRKDLVRAIYAEVTGKTFAEVSGKTYPLPKKIS
jgi:hypothetical protein